MLELLISVTVSAAIIAVFRIYLAARKNRRALFAKYRDQFFSLANQLVADGSLSDQQLIRVKHMAEKIDDVRVLHPLGLALFEIGREIRNGTFKVPPMVLSPQWGSLLYSYYMAVTYLAGIRGIVVRSQIAKLFDPGYGSGGVEQIETIIRSPGLMGSV